VKAREEMNKVHFSLYLRNSGETQMILWTLTKFLPLHSLVNVLVYSVRDKCFRKWTYTLFSKKLSVVSRSEERDRRKSPGRSTHPDGTETRVKVEHISKISNDLSWQHKAVVTCLCAVNPKCVYGSTWNLASLGQGKINLCFCPLLTAFFYCKHTTASDSRMRFSTLFEDFWDRTVVGHFDCRPIHNTVCCGRDFRCTYKCFRK